MAKSKGATEARKLQRKASWDRAQKRKEERKEESKQREKENIATRRAGGLTPWQRAKAARAERRHTH